MALVRVNLKRGPRYLSGKTHLEALIEIAKANGNILIVKTARRLNDASRYVWESKECFEYSIYGH